MTSTSIFDILATSEIGAYAVTVDQTIIFWNSGAQRILGHSVDRVTGRRCNEVLSGLAAGSLAPECQRGCPSLRCLQVGKIPTTLRLRMLCATGVRKPVLLTPMVIGGEENDAPLLVHLFDDGTESQKLDRAAESVRDELTQGGYEIVSDHTEADVSFPVAPSLTARELEVLRLVSLGWQVPDISENLYISPHTVRNHIRHFRHKLKATNRLGAVVNAIRLGILELE